MTGSQARHALSHLAPFDELVQFAKALEEEQGTDFDVFYFLEKPWKWADEYVRWVTAGRPSDPGWDVVPPYAGLRSLTPEDFGHSVRVDAEHLARTAFGGES